MHHASLAVRLQDEVTPDFALEGLKPQSRFKIGGHVTVIMHDVAGKLR